jgi:hypothetical protein
VARARILVYTVATLAALGLSLALGKDVPWDAVNYHLYAGYSVFNDRFGLDYFAAGAQSYFNPYAYAPFYALVQQGFSDVAIASVLAALQSVVLWLTFEISLVVCPPARHPHALWVAALAVLWAVVNPVFLQELGSSFADLTTAIVVLAGWLALLHGFARPGYGRLILGGALIGAACALKMTNVVFAFGACALVLLQGARPSQSAARMALYSIAAVAGFVLAGGAWAWQLWQQFHNPLFPLLNGVFQSSDFTTEPLRLYRFLPDSLGAALWRPFAMVDPIGGVHVELRAPDLRYALLIVLGLAWPVVRLARGSPSRAPRQAMSGDGDTRVLLALIAGFVVCWLMWLLSSGNSRYFLPMSSVASVLLAVLAYRLLRRVPRWPVYVVAVAFALQIGQLALGSALRWNPVAWRGTWVDTSSARRVASEPNLYLTVGVQSFSFLAPHLAPGSGMMNISGGYALTGEGLRGEHPRALLTRFAPHVRVLVESPSGGDSRPSSAGDVLNGALERFGLRADLGDCERFGIPDLGGHASLTSAPSSDRLDTTYLFNCAVVAAPAPSAEELALRRQIELEFDRVEDACPELLQPRRLVTERQGSLWYRFYANTDIKLWINHGWVKYDDPQHGDGPGYIGPESDWANQSQRLACGEKDGHYFIRPAGAAAGH